MTNIRVKITCFYTLKNVQTASAYARQEHGSLLNGTPRRILNEQCCCYRQKHCWPSFRRIP
ncbi:hypothetical protein EMIT0373P_60002 [Pseudomonas chlororaphis]